MLSCEGISRLAQVRANRIATSGGFARTNGVYICRKRWT